MNHVTFEDWMTALRSGKYAQGRGGLRSPRDTFCCLGVLADLIDPDGWTKEPVKGWYAWGPRDVVSYLTPRQDGTPDWFTEYMKRSGAQLNDVGADFLEVADELESIHARNQAAA